MQRSANPGNDFVIQIEIAPVLTLGRARPRKSSIVEAVVVHVLRKAVDHVLDDAKSVVHGGGANLHGGGAARAMCSAASFQ